MWVQGCDWVGLNGKVETSDGQHPFLLVWVNAGCRRSNDPKEAEAKVYIFLYCLYCDYHPVLQLIIVLHVPGISPAATLRHLLRGLPTSGEGQGTTATLNEAPNPTRFLQQCRQCGVSGSVRELQFRVRVTSSGPLPLTKLLDQAQASLLSQLGIT